MRGRGEELREEGRKRGKSEGGWEWMAGGREGCRKGRREGYIRKWKRGEIIGVGGEGEGRKEKI